MKNKILIYFGFAVACIVVIVAFITATSYIHLIIASLLYPPLIYFAYKIFPLNIAHISAQRPETRINQVRQENRVESSNKQYVVSDIDKRAFLKLVGATGLSFLMISIFGRKIESLFNGQSIQMPSLNSNPPSGLTNPSASVSPTEGYAIAEIDEGDIGYYGFINKQGAWFIMKEDLESGSFRYVKGGSDFPSNWAKRENLKYDYFHEVFL